MRSMHKPNISRTEQVASALIGTALAAVGYRRNNRGVAFTGLGMIARGVSGYCPVSALIGRDTATSDTRQALGGSRGVIVEDAITIYRPVHEVYSYWRNFENLPRFMSHLGEVHETGGMTSHWVAWGPLGVRVEWDAEIISDIPNQLISWKSVGDADVVSAGSVWFKPADGDHGTDVRVNLQYDPPAGKLGATVAWLLGEDPQHQIAEDLRRFKQLLETGEVSTGARTRPRATRSRKGARVTEPEQIMTEPTSAT